VKRIRRVMRVLPYSTVKPDNPTGTT
jgi:hypothetical protein